MPRSHALFGVWLIITPVSVAAGQQSRACWLVTPAEAAQILGKPDLANGEAMHDDYATCNYLRAGFDVHLNHGRTVANLRQALDADIKSGKVEAVAGLGDRAGFDRSAKQPSLVVIKGAHVLEIRLLSSDAKGSPDQIRPTMLKLAETALAKLSSTGNAKASRACWLITPAEAAQILGRPELRSGDAIHDDYDDCDYKAAGFDLDMLSYTRAAPRLEGFNNLVKKGNAEAVAGIGDAAILGHDAGKRPTINILKGRREFMITWIDSGQATADVKSKLVQLAKTAMAKLP
jgi:hypothetical protein